MTFIDHSIDYHRAPVRHTTNRKTPAPRRRSPEARRQAAIAYAAALEVLG